MVSACFDIIMNFVCLHTIVHRFYRSQNLLKNKSSQILVRSEKLNIASLYAF